MNPELRFKDQDGNDFPDWEEKKIKEIGRVTMCKRIFKDQTLAWGEIPFFKIGTFGDIPDAYITRELFEDFKKKYPYPQKGNILISASGSIGKLVEYNGEDAYFQDSNIIWLEHKNDVLDKYLKQIYPTLNWEEGLEGSTIKRLYNKVFLNKVIFLPQVLEQSKISALLSDIDKKIESQAILVEKLKNTKDAMFVKMFPQGDNVNPTLRFKKEDGSSYADWRKEKLNKIASPKARIGWQGMRQSEFLDFGDYYLITGTDFDNGSINFDTCCYVEKYRYDQDKNIQVHNGDILITKDGTLGKVAYISNMDKPATLNAGVFVLNNLDEKMDSLFLYHYLAAPFLMEYANQQATGGTIKHLNQKVLVSFEVPIPEKEEQIKIGKCLSDLDKEIEINQQKYEKLCDVKKALLSKLFPTKEDE